jgi:Cu+-exporting ATPase
MVTVGAPAQVELLVGGMTCASCVSRVERRLNRLDGVVASVNLATERATVSYDPSTVDTDGLVAAVESAGYTAALPSAPSGPAAPAAGGLFRRLVVSGVLAAPVVLISMAFHFPGWQWIALALATPVASWGALPFHRAALVNARHGAATMDTLISLGVTAAYLWSWYAAVSGGETYLEVAAAVTVFLLAGRFLEARARLRAGAALRALAELGAREATVLVDGAERTVPAASLVVGDIFVVRPGQVIATDGTVHDGQSAVDAAMLTGEPAPVEVGPGDAVIGGTLNVGGRLVVRASRVGADTALAAITRLVERAQAGRAPVQRLADRISAVFVPVVLVLALATLAGWLLSGGTAAESFAAAVAVLIIACPCALGLATPTALLVGTGRGAQLGILIRGPEILESTRRVDTIVLDKTGTVTTGELAVLEVHGDPAALRLAGAVEAASEHPIGRAIAAAATTRHGALPAVAAFAAHAGLGVTGAVDGTTVHIGRHLLSAGRPAAGSPAPGSPAPGSPAGAGGGASVGGGPPVGGGASVGAVAVPAGLAEVAAAAEAAGRTAVPVAWDGAVRAVLVVGDSVRDSSAAAVRGFVSLGLRPVLLTGDAAGPAGRVAAAVGIGEVVAGVLPAGKVALVERLQREGRVVAMVGDGVNDAAALARADLGIAMGGGTDVAIEASDLTLVRADLLAAVDAIRLARRTLATIRGNLFWAFAYNVAALPLAAFGLLNPLIAGAAMAGSSLFVLGNSLLLRRFSPARPGSGAAPGAAARRGRPAG